MWRCVVEKRQKHDCREVTVWERKRSGDGWVDCKMWRDAGLGGDRGDWAAWKFCDAEDNRGGVERKRTTVEDQDDERKDGDLTDVCTSHGRPENHGREPWQDGSEPELVFNSTRQWRSWG